MTRPVKSKDKTGELTPSSKENLSVENANQKGYSVWKYEE
jgi:hypothetical protein